MGDCMVMGELLGPPVGDEKAGVAERELPSETIKTQHGYYQK